MNIRSTLNEVYSPLVGRMKSLLSMLEHNSGYDCSCGFFNGHYQKDEDGTYTEDLFPIPVIAVKDICDIEFGLQYITVTTKLKKKDALGFEYQKIADIPFEIYGVRDYLTDYYAEGDRLDAAMQKIETSGEEEFFFSFVFTYSASEEGIFRFVTALNDDRFFY